MSGNINKRSRLDRSIVMLLPHPPDDTPSRNAGITAAEERLYRMYGVSMMEDVCQILDRSMLLPTAATIFHRYFHQVSFTDQNLWGTAMASVLLAAKMEDIVMPVKSIIIAFVHVYRKRASLSAIVDETTRHTIQTHPLVRFVVKEMVWLQDKIPPMSQLGPAWKEWHYVVVQTESSVLRQLGFCLYWIPERHPHRYVTFFLRALNLNADASVLERALYYCSLSLRLDFSVRFDPHVIAVAAIYIAAMGHTSSLPKQWWHTLSGTNHDQDMSNVVNGILGLEDVLTNVDVMIATSAFVRSPESESFLDPGSFLWEYMISEELVYN
jgi:cyclin L